MAEGGGVDARPQAAPVRHDDEQPPVREPLPSRARQKEARVRSLDSSSSARTEESRPPASTGKRQDRLRPLALYNQWVGSGQEMKPRAAGRTRRAHREPLRARRRQPRPWRSPRPSRLDAAQLAPSQRAPRLAPSKRRTTPPRPQANSLQIDGIEVTWRSLIACGFKRP